MTEPLTSLAKRFETGSQVESAVYDADRSELRVVFKGSNQIIYAYQGATPQLWADLLAAPSIGSFLHYNVKKAGLTFEKRDAPGDIERQKKEFAEMLAEHGHKTPADAAPLVNAEDSSDLVDEGAALATDVIEAITESAGPDTAADINPGGGDFGGAGADGDF